MLYPVSYKPGGGLQTMTSVEFETVANHVLEYFATVNGPGNIYSTDPGSGTLIGSITDTSYTGNVGEGDTTIISSVYNVYQDLTPPVLVDDMPPVLVYDTNQSALRLTATSEIDEFAVNILNYGVNNEGPGSYVISTTTPVGGTWSAIGVLNDVISNATPTVEYTLYKKIAADSYVLNRPVKVFTDGNTVNLQRLSDAEIDYLTTRVRQKIIDTGIGQYVFQETAPVSGTWVEKGTVVDTLPTTTSSSYSNDYTSISDTNYEVAISYTGLAYTADYVGDSGGTFVGGTPTGYLGPVAYTNENAAAFTVPGVTYLGPITYIGDNGANFTVPGTAYSGPASYTLDGIFTGSTPVYTADTASGSFQAGPVYSAAGPNFYAAGAEYTVVFISYYTGQLSYTGAQIFTDPDGTTFSSAPIIYSGPSPFTNPNGTSFAAAPITYSGPSLFTNVDGASFGGFIPTNYTGPATFAVAFNSTFLAASEYTGTFDGIFNVTANYTGSYDSVYDLGPVFSSPVTYTGDTVYTSETSFVVGVSYAGPAVEVAYSGPPVYFNGFDGPGIYSSAPTYTGADTVAYVHETDPYFASQGYYQATGTPDSALYDNIQYAVIYAGGYTGPSTVYYTGPNVYTGPGSFLSGPNDTSYVAPNLFYTGTTLYTRENSVVFSGTLDYTGVISSYSSTFEGTVYTGTIATYTGSFEGPAYTGPSGYTGPSAPNLYTTTYDLSIINNPNAPEVYSDPTDTNTYTGIATQIVTTKKLWRRIA